MENSLPDTGLILGPLQNLRTLISESAAWQAWTETDEEIDAAAAAREHTYLLLPPPALSEADWSIEELQSKRPFATVWWKLPDQTPSFEVSKIGTMAYVDTSQLLMRFEADVPDEYATKHYEPIVWFLEKVQLVVEEMIELAATTNPLLIRRISVSTLPDRSALEARPTEGDVMGMNFQVDIGM